MAILEKEVWVNINQRNINYYKKLGYLNIQLHSKALIKIDHLLKTSKVRVTKICDNPNCDVKGGRLIEDQIYQTVIQGRSKNHLGCDLCINCGRVLSWERRKNNIKYEKTLEYFAIVNKKEFLLKEFSSKNLKKPNQISFSTLDEYMWDCPKCESEYNATVSTRTNCDSACPYCHGKAINHTNCLWTTHPEIASLLKNEDDGYNYSKGTHTKVDWVCPDCESVVKNKSIGNVVFKGLKCPKCSDGYSYPEKFMFNILDQLGICFELQKTFNWSENRKYDFYIPSLNCIIETHGEQHYRHTGFKRTLEKERENDRLKENLAKENEIENYIVVDCRYSDLEWIKNNILSSKFNELYNLTQIDWNICNQFATSSLVKSVCNLYHKGNSVTEIMHISKLSRFPVLKYLKQGTNLGWCHYDPKEEMRKMNKLNKNSSKPVVRLSLQGEYIDEFESGVEVERSLGISSKYISAVCTGKIKTTNGYRFMFKEDYDKCIKEQTKESIFL